MYGVEENRGLAEPCPTMGRGSIRCGLKARFYEIRVDVPSIQEAPQDIQADPSLHRRWLSNREDLAFTEATPSLRAVFKRAGETLESTIPGPSVQEPYRGIKVRVVSDLADEIAKIPGVYVNEI